MAEEARTRIKAELDAWTATTDKAIAEHEQKEKQLKSLVIQAAGSFLIEDVATLVASYVFEGLLPCCSCLLC
jgi:hypothetical protein